MITCMEYITSMYVLRTAGKHMASFYSTPTYKVGRTIATGLQTHGNKKDATMKKVQD